MLLPTSSIDIKKLERPGTQQSLAILQVSQQFEAGQLHKFIREWRMITSDPFILVIVEHCHLDFDEDNTDHLFDEDIEYVFSEEEKGIICQEVEKLLSLKVIKVTHIQDHQITSPIFLRKKKNGEFRMVIDLEKLNRHIACKHFKMENFEQAFRLINQGDFMASIDLRHA